MISTNNFNRTALALIAGITTILLVSMGIQGLAQATNETKPTSTSNETISTTPSPQSATSTATSQLTFSVLNNETKTINLSQAGLQLENIIFAGYPAHGTVSSDVTAQTFTYTPAPGYAGEDLIAVAYKFTSETEFRGLVAKITVTSPTQIPVFDQEQNFSVSQNRSLAVTLDSSTDSSPTVELLVAPTHGYAETNNASRSISYLPAPDYVGTDTVFVRYCRTSSSNAQVCTVIKINYTIDPVTSFPVQRTLSNKSRIAFDLAQSGKAIFSNDIITQPQHGTITINTDSQTAVYDPEDTYIGEDSFKFRVCYQPQLSCAVIDYRVTLTQ